MIAAAGISFLLVALVACMGLLIQVAVYFNALYFFSPKSPGAKPFMFPALITIPLSIYIFYQVFEISLIFPVFLKSDFTDIFMHALVPSLLLGIASGFFSQLKSQTHAKVEIARNSCFMRMVKGYGKSKFKQLFPLVVPPVFIEAFSSSIIILAGELIVVEALFNIPGLATLFWKYSKTQHYSGIFEILFVVALLATVPMIAKSIYHKKISQRFEAW